MGLRLHHDGRFRRWLGARFGRDEAFGDRLWRRCLHGVGAAILLYYAVPDGFFLVVPKAVVLLAALAVLGVLELLRFTIGLELPTIRAYEARRPASYLFYAVALVVTVLLFPRPVAAAAVLGTALVDPLVGELRSEARWARLETALPFAVYTVLATLALVVGGAWPVPWAVALALGAAAIALAVERRKHPWLDDDLTMTLAPALFLYGLGVVALGLAG